MEGHTLFKKVKVDPQLTNLGANISRKTVHITMGNFL